MIVGGIDTKDISVVMQGGIDLAITPKCVIAAYESFPGAEVILSTWKGAPTSDIVADKIIYNQDPGGMQCSHAIDNTNRQIVSSRNGVYQATRRYILKIRSDCCVKSPKMLTFWNLYPNRSESYRWFEHRVIMPTLYCKRFLDINSKIPTPFHYSDWVQFGLSEDIQKIWDIDTIGPEEFVGTYSAQNYMGNKLRGLWTENRYVAETYIFSSGIKKCFPQINYRGFSDYCSEMMIQSEEILFNNFILMEPEHLDVVVEKEPYRTIIADVDAFRKPQPGCYYTEREYKEICEKKAKA